MTLTRTITAPLQTEVAERLDEWAERHGKTRSWAIRMAVYQFLEREEYREKKIADALHSVDNNQIHLQDELLECFNRISSEKGLTK